MLKHMLASNGGIGNRGGRLDSSMVMEPRENRYRPGNPAVPSARRMQQEFPLNASNLNTSKHSLMGGAGGNSLLSPSLGKSLNGGLNISRARNPLAGGALNSTISKHSIGVRPVKQIGVKEMLISLGLLCLVSLLLALLSLIFLLKISPVTANDIRELLRAEQLTVITAEEYAVVYEVTLALCALTLSLNLCCLLVCAIQFLFAVKLVKSPHGGNDSVFYRTNKYLQKSSVSRVCAVGGFFISIPVFLTGIILYTFIQFHSTPAIVTSVFIGLGIIFCGCAMVHNVFIWQREKTNAVKELALQQHDHTTQAQHFSSVNSIAAVTSPNSPLGTSIIAGLNSPLTPGGLLGANGNGSIINNNQSHISYNHSFVHSPNTQLHNSTVAPYNIIRPSTTTPPTGESVVKLAQSHPREASGSVSPGMPNATLDLSSVATTNSPHELSTLV